ncbi:NADH-quinone oxidoreductase subunit L [uncultured Streptococcus sp.]|uniref:NADH-quinone oxidoreductase subunit L n=1 Tax=uncultured Streptococcus sp. TaxID=83427 RepID=UPI002666CAAA|nr:NADH-quinone oxidoreductase subunit L [uncultured Streptococcus sp.]
MSLEWYYWLLFAASWIFAITFWVKSAGISQKWLRFTFVIAGIIAFLLPFFWGWLVS